MFSFVYISLPRLLRSRNCFSFANIWVHPWFFGGDGVANLFSCLCRPIMCPYVLSSALWCPLLFPCKYDVWFGFASGSLLGRSCLICAICVCLYIVVANAYCVVFLFYLSSSCVLYVVSFSWLSIFFIAPSVRSNVYQATSLIST